MSLSSAPVQQKSASARANPHEDSPLWMVSNVPDLHRLVVELRRTLVVRESDAPCVLELSRAEVDAARAGFTRMILHGERDLHRLGGLLADGLIQAYRLRSIAIGEIRDSGVRFTLEQDLDEDELYRLTDLDLGNRLMSRLKFDASAGGAPEGSGWCPADLVSNVVAYEALEPNPAAVTRILTRIKAEEEICNKVADELFDLDRIVSRDKELRHLSRYVKDVFGIKVVVLGDDDVKRAQEKLTHLSFDPRRLEALDLPADERHLRPHFIEVKDYVDGPKQSGWSAVKSVVRWRNRTFEIQIQSLQNFLRERERLTRESHEGFKATRERVRDEVAVRIPLFGFCRLLLQWLFVHPTDSPPPEHPEVRVSIRD